MNAFRPIDIRGVSHFSLNPSVVQFGRLVANFQRCSIVSVVLTRWLPFGPARPHPWPQTLFVKTIHPAFHGATKVGFTQRC